MARFRLPNGGWGRVDDVDTDLIMNAQPAWRKSPHGYIWQTSPKHTYLHRAIMERVLGRKLKRSERVDHENGDRTDCRRDNIRLATAAQNKWNSHRPKVGKQGYRGVSALKGSPNYRAYVVVDDKQVSLGVYATPEEAAHAYNLYVMEHRTGYEGKLNDVQPVALKPITHYKTKTPGVRKQGKRWQARAKIKGKEYHVGNYETQAEAVEARKKFIEAAKR